METPPIDDGGPAFPFGFFSPGMSLRDYIAAHALSGILASPLLTADIPDGTPLAPEAAAAAYRYADAMLAARNPTTP